MNTYHFVVNILLCVLVTTNCVAADDNKEKDELVDDILHYVDADAYTFMDQSLNKVFDTQYDFNNILNRGTTKDHLKQKTVIELRKIKGRALECIHCTIAFAAEYMIAQFTLFVQHMVSNPSTKNENLQPFGYVASSSKIVWRKAISATISIHIEPGHWLWQMLIFTNTISDVVNKKYPGMTDVEDVFGRIMGVLQNLLKTLKSVGDDCIRENESVWNLKMPDDDSTKYDKNLFKAKDFLCPGSNSAAEQMNTLCDHFEYVENFDKFLYRNKMKHVFSYDKHDNFDPYKWLVTYPSLKRAFVDGITNSNLKSLENNLDTFVKPISNDDWVLQYSSKYFETVRNMSEVVLQTTLQLLIRNFVLCEKYWKSIPIFIGDSKEHFDFKNECTDNQASIEMIMKKFNLDKNEILQTLHEVSGRIFTSDVEYLLVVNFIDAEFNSDVLLTESGSTSSDPSTIQIVKSYKEQLKTYSDELPKIYTEEFALFQKAFDMPMY